MCSIQPAGDDREIRPRLDRLNNKQNDEQNENENKQIKTVGCCVCGNRSADYQRWSF